jgi:hypothetical protein
VKWNQNKNRVEGPRGPTKDLVRSLRTRVGGGGVKGREGGNGEREEKEHCKKSRQTFRCPFKEYLSDVE